MAIVVEDAPAELMKVLSEGVVSLPPEGDDGAAHEGISIYRPLPLFGVMQQRDTGPTDEAPLALERIGWRILIQEGATLAMAEVRYSDDGIGVTAVWRGAVAEALAAATIAAERAMEGETIWQARLIALPDIGLDALWLHSPGSDDVALPLLEEELRTTPLSTLAAEAKRRISARGSSVAAPYADGKQGSPADLPE